MQAFGKGIYSGEVTNASSSSGIVASITCYNQNNFNQQLHYHDNTHISFVLHGGCVEKKKDGYERLPGRLTCYYAGEPHQVMNVAKQSRHINIEIEPAFFTANNLTETSMFSALSKNPDTKYLMLDIYREILSADAFSKASIQLLLLNLIHNVEKCAARGAMPAWVRAVREQLHDKWNENIVLQNLADTANVHPVTISKYFPKYFSCTLGQYMRKLKIEKSLALIKQEGALLTSVAYECGFADQSHFIRTFKQLTGFLPAQYQKL